MVDLGGMKTNAVLFALAVVALLPAARARAAEPAPARPLAVDALVASVNGDPVTLSDVQETLRPHLENARRAMPAERDPDVLYRIAFTNALRDLENKQLVLQQYWAGQARLPENAVDRAATERIEKLYGGDVHALQLDLAREGRTYAEWKSDLEERLIVSNMRQLYVDSNVHVSPAEVVRAWETDRDSYIPKPAVHVAVAVFPAAEPAAREAFLARVAGGEPFEKLAAGSGERERELGAGDYGWIDPAVQLAPSFSAAVLALEDGGTSEPLVLGDWCYLLHRVETEPVETPALDSAWEKIENALWARASEAQFRAWIDHLRGQAAIREYLPDDLL